MLVYVPKRNPILSNTHTLTRNHLIAPCPPHPRSWHLQAKTQRSVSLFQPPCTGSILGVRFIKASTVELFLERGPGAHTHTHTHTHTHHNTHMHTHTRARARANYTHTHRASYQASHAWKRKSKVSGRHHVHLQALTSSPVNVRPSRGTTEYQRGVV
jgi:hypothetical protein